MKCPYCGHEDTSVLESRVAPDQESMRRRRCCVKCQKRFTTYERAEGVDLTVIKKNGERQPFDREKIRKGLMKATWKRPISVEDIDALIGEVEKKLRRKESTVVKSWEIGKLVMNRLRKIDPVSYLLFASVYRDFQTIGDFAAELKSFSGPHKIAQKLAAVPAEKRKVVVS
jgi:transcriptional repressor NrdR